MEGVTFSTDGKTLALASRDKTVQLWDVASGTLLKTLAGHSSFVNAVAFAPDGRTLASGGNDQTVRLWNAETGRELMQLDSGKIALGQVQALAFSQDGKNLLAGGGNLALWSTVPSGSTQRCKSWTRTILAWPPRWRPRRPTGTPRDRRGPKPWRRMTG